MYYFLLLIFIISISACNKEVSDMKKEEQKKAPISVTKNSKEFQDISISQKKSLSTKKMVKISPERPKKGDTLMVSLSGIESGGATYKWYINDNLLKEFKTPFLQTNSFSKGDKIYVKVTTFEGEYISKPVIIENSPPQIKSVYLLPESSQDGGIVKAAVTTQDIDGDDVTLYYEWSVNGEPVDNNSNILRWNFKRGDNVSVKVTPSDKESKGVTVTRNITIANSSPKVQPDIKGLQLKDNILTGQIIATDPDGDDIIFTLLKGPKGLEIDNNGNIFWKVPEDAKGLFPIKVSVKDNQGGETVFNFDLTITSKKISSTSK